MMTANLPRSLTFGALFLGFGSAVTAAPIAFNGSTDLTSNVQTDLMWAEPQGRYLYSYSRADEQIEALEIIEETGELVVPASGNLLSDGDVDALTSVEDMVFSNSARYLFLVNSDPGANGGSGLHVLRRGAGTENVDFPVALNAADVDPGSDCVGTGLSATHEVYAVELVAQSDGNYLYMGTVDTAGDPEVVACELNFSPDSNDDVEMTFVDRYVSADFAGVDISNPRDLKRVEEALYYVVGDPGNAVITLALDENGGGINYASHVAQGPAVGNALCNPSQITFTSRYSDNVWVTASDASSCSDSETANAIVTFERNSIGSLQFLSFSQESGDSSVRLDDITGLAATTDAKTPLYAISRAENAISYLRYDSEEEELADPAPLVEGDLTEGGAQVTGLQGATQLAIEPNRGAFMYVGSDSNNKIGGFARLSDLDLTVRRTNTRLEPGRGLRMTAIITNEGPADARDVELEVFYPRRFILTENPTIEGEAQGIECEYDPGTFKCQLSGMPVSDTRRVSFIVKPQNIGDYETTFVARSSNRLTFEKIQAVHDEKTKVGSFNNGGAIAMSPWVLLLALPLLWRRRD